jgi:hypothetical protein
MDLEGSRGSAYFKTVSQNFLAETKGKTKNPSRNKLSPSRQSNRLIPEDIYIYIYRERERERERERALAQRQRKVNDLKRRD